MKAWGGGWYLCLTSSVPAQTKTWTHPVPCFLPVPQPTPAPEHEGLPWRRLRLRVINIPDHNRRKEPSRITTPGFSELCKLTRTLHCSPFLSLFYSLHLATRTRAHPLTVNSAVNLLFKWICTQTWQRPAAAIGLLIFCMGSSTLLQMSSAGKYTLSGWKRIDSICLPLLFRAMIHSVVFVYSQAMLFRLTNGSLLKKRFSGLSRRVRECSISGFSLGLP